MEQDKKIVVSWFSKKYGCYQRAEFKDLTKAYEFYIVQKEQKITGTLDMWVEVTYHIGLV